MHAGRVRRSQVGLQNVVNILPEAMFTDSLVVFRCFEEGAFTCLGIRSNAELAIVVRSDITNKTKRRLMIKLCHPVSELLQNQALLSNAEAEGTGRTPR